MSLIYNQVRRGSINPGDIPFNSVYAQSATQEFALGARLELWDGRKFRYAKAGASALSKGKMTQSVAPTANHTNVALTGSSAAIGDTTIAIASALSTALVLNEYAEGWLIINDATGEGQVYQIKGNDAGTTGNIYLYEGIKTALVATSEFTLVRNRFASVIVFPTTATSTPAGVPLIDVTATYYFWSQVAGPAPLLVDTGDTVVIGNPVGEPATHADAGSCGVVDASMATAKPWGRCMVVEAATEYALIDLTLE
jgi:hypothetical protein